MGLESAGARRNAMYVHVCHTCRVTNARSVAVRDDCMHDRQPEAAELGGEAHPQRISFCHEAQGQTRYRAAGDAPPLREAPSVADSA